jgi:hypothetical protein
MKDSIQLTASPRLLEIFSKINHAISLDIIEMIKFKYNSIISYLDIGNDNDTITFIYSNKYQELINGFGDNAKELVWKQKRSDMKVGKLIKTLFGDKYPVNVQRGSAPQKRPSDIESFVNMFKAEREKNENSERFEIVNGIDIVKWYCVDNYSRFAYEDTPLGKSCMRYKESGKFLELYFRNPDNVSMLILKDNVGKLRGRALIWKLNDPDRIYMDRIYTVNDFDIEIFKNYARTNKWLFKQRQTFGWQNDIVDGINNNVYSFRDMIMKMKLKYFDFEYYPYLDTLTVLDKKNGILSNEGKLLIKPGYIHLSDYQGRFFDEAEYRELVFSRIYNQEIVKENSVFSEIDNEWVYNIDCVYVHNTNGKMVYKNNPLIVKSTIFGKCKYFLKDDAVFSEYLKTWIFKKSSRKAYLEFEMKNEVIIHKKMTSRFFKKDSNGNYIKSTNLKDIEEFENEMPLFETSVSYTNPGTMRSLRISGDSNIRTYDIGDNSTVNIPTSFFNLNPPLWQIVNNQNDVIIQHQNIDNTVHRSSTVEEFLNLLNDTNTRLTF